MKTALVQNSSGLKIGMDRRRGMRFAVQASCAFWWQPESDQTLFGVGSTLNLSSCGLAVAAPALPAPGHLIAVEIELPTTQHSWLYRRTLERHEPASPLSWKGEGRIVWVDARRGFFAAQIAFQALDAALQETLTNSPGGLPS